ncbi:MAG: helix-turn-helix domain-containing protein [Pseudomonadota bacterium]
MSDKLKYARDTELAQRYQISRSTVWRWVNQGLLPAPIKIAGSSRFDIAACDRAFNQGSADEAA